VVHLYFLTRAFYDVFGSIVLDRITSPVAAVVISVTAVLFFGEVIPQAICSRYGLAIGAKVEWYPEKLFYFIDVC